MTATRLTIVVGLALLVLTCTWATAQPKAEPKLVFASTVMPGMPRPGDEVYSGLLIALWSDGTVVHARDPRKPGRDLQAGRVRLDQVTLLLSELKEAGFYQSHKGGGVIPDSASVTLISESEGRTVRHSNWWTDPDRASLNADSGDDERRFAMMWTRSRTAAAFARPGSSVPLPSDKAAEALYKKAEQSLR
jgi:hypothetical protein